MWHSSLQSARLDPKPPSLGRSKRTSPRKYEIYRSQRLSFNPDDSVRGHLLANAGLKFNFPRCIQFVCWTYFLVCSDCKTPDEVRPKCWVSTIQNRRLREKPLSR